MPDSTDDAPRVTIERDGHVLLIGINRAHKRNAMDLKALDALADAYLLLDQDPEFYAWLASPDAQQLAME